MYHNPQQRQPMADDDPSVIARNNDFVLRRWDSELFPWSCGISLFVRPKQRFAKLQNVTERMCLLTNGRSLSIDFSKCIPVLPSSNGVCSVYVVRDTDSFRQWAKAQSNKKDAVLEIGCSTGQTSAIFWKRTKSWVGFDSSQSMVETVKKSAREFEQSACYHIDALQHPDHAAELSATFGTPSLVFCDINGNRGLDGVVQMLNWILSRVKCRAIVIKSEQLDQALQGTWFDAAESQAWMQRVLKETRKLPIHPLQAPLVYNPKCLTQPICRYFNYDVCHRGNSCHYDHQHCHLCQKAHHQAKFCPILNVDD